MLVRGGPAHCLPGGSFPTAQGPSFRKKSSSSSAGGQPTQEPGPKPHVPRFQVET